MNKILVIYAHPEAPPSRANRAIRASAQRFLNSLPFGLKVTWHDLYEAYPNFHIRVDSEQALLLAHQVLVFQHPFYWYSVPALLKQWIDEVLADGWAYGRGAQALKGKVWAHWVTAGGSGSAYRQGGQNNFSVTELMRPLEQTALLCGSIWQTPQFTHSSLTLSDEDLLVEGERYGRWLKSLAALSLQTHSNS